MKISGEIGRDGDRNAGTGKNCKTPAYGFVPIWTDEVDNESCNAVKFTLISHLDRMADMDYLPENYYFPSLIVARKRLEQ